MFEVQRRRPVAHQPSSAGDSDQARVRMMTAAEQKMDKNVKKIKKTSKIPKWNPNEWNIDDGKSCVRLKGRRWDDVSVPDWARSFGTHGLYGTSPHRRKEDIYEHLPEETMNFLGQTKDDGALP